MKSLVPTLCLLAVLPVVAQAATPKPTPVPGAEQSQRFQPSGAYAQVYYYPAADREKEAGSATTDYSGDGFGVSGLFPFSIADVNLFAIGDYSMIDYDDVTPASPDDKIDEWRLGVGYQVTPEFSAYVHLNDRENGKNAAGASVGSDGYAVHAAYTLPLQDTPFSFYGDVGYFLLQNQADVDIDGYEFLVGAMYAVNSRFSGFLDYRGSDFDVDDAANTSIKYYDFRAGVRINF